MKANDKEMTMASDQGIEIDQKGEQQPKDKDRAQTVHSTDKKAGSSRSADDKNQGQERESAAKPNSRDDV